MMIGNLGAPDAGPNTLTKISGGAGDATFSYSAVSPNRTWNGDAFTANFQTGNVGINSNLISTNGHIQLLKGSTNNNGLNIFGGANNQGAAFSFGNNNNPDGIGEQQSRGIITTQLGTGGQPFMAAINPNQPANNGWYPSSVVPQVTFGGLELGDANNFGNSDLATDGSFGTVVTNTALDLTLTVDNSTVTVNGFGTRTITLPDATFHCKGRIYQIKNQGTTNCIVATTSLQAIDGKPSYTNAPRETITVQSDGVGWSIISTYGGAPTNFVALTATGITNTWNWPAAASILGTAVTYTNYDGAGQAYETNTTLANDDQYRILQPGGAITAASGLSGIMHAIGR
jgi:hypothetical protein